MGGESYRRRLGEMRKMDRELVGLRVENERLKINLRDAQKDFAERVTGRDQFIDRLKAASTWALLRWRFFGGLIVLLLACAPSAFAQFAPPDVSAMQVVGADRSVLDFPRTARLSDFRVEQGAMTIHTTGAENWPAVAIESGGEPVQSATLWVGLKIGGTWYATGAERLRPNQLNGVKPEAEGPGELQTLIGNGWLYDAGRWRPMAGYNPAFGEPVCVMVAAGSTRSDNNTPVHARTQWRCLSWPNGATLWDEGTTNPQQPPAPPDTPPTPPVVPTQPPVAQPPALDLSGVEARLGALETKVSDLAAADKKDHDDIIKAVNSPSWLGQVGKFLTSPTGMSAASALGGFLTYYLTHQSAPVTAAKTAATTTTSTQAIGLAFSVGVH